MRQRRLRAVIGLAIGLSIVGLLVYGVGWESVLEHISEANPLWLGAGFAAGAGVLVFRGLIVERLLGPIDGSATGLGFVTAFLGGYFARSALPWGRSVGTPITAYLLAVNSDSEFEDNLAVVATAEVFAFLASLVIALVGIILVTVVTGPSDDLLVAGTAAAVGGLFAIGVLVVVVTTGWAKRASIGLTARVERFVGRFPRVDNPGGRLTNRVDGFFTTISRIGAARRTIATALLVALVSWILNVLPLYFAFLALGIDAPFAVALLCAPLASFGALLPLPGGTGGIEIVLATLLVAIGGLSGDVATAAALLFRLTTYWVHLLLGGFGALYLSIAGTTMVLRP